MIDTYFIYYILMNGIETQIITGFFNAEFVAKVGLPYVIILMMFVLIVYLVWKGWKDRDLNIKTSNERTDKWLALLEKENLTNEKTHQINQDLIKQIQISDIKTANSFWMVKGQLEMFDSTLHDISKFALIWKATVEEQEGERLLLKTNKELQDKLKNKK